MGHIATKTIDVSLFDPKLHGLDHGCPQGLLAVVQAHHVRPVFYLGTVVVLKAVNFAFVVFKVPIGVLLDPHMIPCSVVGHPIDDDLHA